jgi:predicted phosphodiesterase
MKVDWITDPHLDHLRDGETLITFLQALHDRDSDALLVTGDITQSQTIYDFLGFLSGAYQRPIYFVLGNHDYYGSWIEPTQKRVRAACSACPEGILNWMTDRGPIMLTSTVAVVGHDGMYDAKAGEPGMDLGMTDFLLPGGIVDFAYALETGSWHLFELLERLARASAEHITTSVRKAVRAGARRILVLTHVPPFPEASYFRGRPSNPRALPWYVNVTLGNALLALADELPDVSLEVFAGHTHGATVYQPRPTLIVHVGGARYGRPRFQQQLSV